MPTKTSRRTFKSRTTRKAPRRTGKGTSRWSGKKTASRWSGKKTAARSTGKTTPRKARRTTTTKARRSAWKAAKTWKIGSWSRTPARRAA